MSVYVRRTWLAPVGLNDGNGWPVDVVQKFEALMRKHAVKRRGLPVLISSWDDGRGRGCWYDGRVGPEETAIRNECRRMFGVHESDGGEERSWPLSQEGPSPQRRQA